VYLYLFIPDTARLYVQFLDQNKPLAQCAVSLKHWFICKALRVVAYKSLKEGEVQLGSPQSGRGRLRDLFITKFK